jgi:two-component system, NarL family, sensor histidine kinase DesK
MQFKEQEVWILIISTSLLLIFIGGIFLLLLLISRKRKLNFQQLIMEEKIKSQNLEIEKKNILIKERERIIKDLHDDLGGSLNSIQLIGDLIMNHDLEEIKLKESIAKISNTSKNISQQMKTVVWSMDSEKDSLLNLVEYINYYSKDFFQPTAIQFEFTNNTIEDKFISGFLRKNIFLVIKEAINNIIKHSNATRASVDFKIVDNTILIAIKDNGIGIEAINSFGNGLKNIKNRIAEINGSITIQKENGTLILIEVGLHYQNNSP